MKLEVKLYSKNVTADDFGSAIFSAVDNAWNYIIKEILPTFLVSFLFFTCFCLALGISLLTFLASILVANTPITRNLGIIASILLAVFAFKKIYPKT